ncbi:hypothetical protein AGLY_011129 [Aphis glycines]|uniref:Uncharacterized protein n=1 Tax=Aphis glycines TaxID=307491 RepID=A0A6G0TET2_APHGL|nr:hypothetical protein AGLY_011129 [Aphis glycines]
MYSESTIGLPTVHFSPGQFTFFDSCPVYTIRSRTKKKGFQLDVQFLKLKKLATLSYVPKKKIIIFYIGTKLKNDIFLTSNANKNKIVTIDLSIKKSTGNNCLPLLPKIPTSSNLLPKTTLKRHKKRKTHIFSFNVYFVYPDYFAKILETCSSKKMFDTVKAVLSSSASSLAFSLFQWESNNDPLQHFQMFPYLPLELFFLQKFLSLNWKCRFSRLSAELG